MPTLKFGAVLRKTRKAQGVSMDAVAQELGVSTPYIWDVENSRRAALSDERIARVARFLEVEAEPLIAAAALERGSVALPIADHSPKDRLALALAAGWATLSSDQVEAIGAIIGRAA